MSRMSVCLNAAMEASAAVAAAKKHAAALRQHTTAAAAAGGVSDGTTAMPSQSSLATFLDFQRSLSQRFDALKVQQPQVRAL
jgi:hypothetical protein